jgi:hypothetical protein
MHTMADFGTTSDGKTATRIRTATRIQGRLAHTPDKQLVLGRRGGVHWVSADGKRIYLKADERRRCLKGLLKGDIHNLCATLNVKDPDLYPRRTRIRKTDPFTPTRSRRRAYGQFISRGADLAELLGRPKAVLV